MANNVKNIIRMKGIANLPLFEGEEDRFTGEKYRSLDFDKIVPMPQELLAVNVGGMENSYIRAALCKIKDVLNEGTSFSRNRNAITIDKESIKPCYTDESFDDMAIKGLDYITNAVKHGATDWYQWRLENWGTKSNAYYTEIIDEDTISFCTAWNAPEEIISKLAEMYPDIEIEHLWADEDIGRNAGYREYCDGEVHGGPESDIQNLYELYVQCWGETDRLYMDDDGMLHLKEDEDEV